MKKFLVTILCFVYVAASSGATIDFHYCMGKFIGWDIGVAAPATCNNCGMGKEQNKGCCNDKHTILQLKKEQIASNINTVPVNHFLIIQHYYLSFKYLFTSFNKDVTPLTNSPPLIAHSLLIFNCNFRI